MVSPQAVELESNFRHPPIRASVDTLVRHFASSAARERAPLRNPHFESKVDEAARARATRASVLIPIVTGPELRVILTRRHRDISFPGHIAFPGGRRDPSDATPLETALREAEEEIGLARDRVRVLGRLGDYVSHSGFCIAPVVGLIDPPVELVPQEGEVEEILEIPLDTLLDSQSYGLRGRTRPDRRAHFYLAYGEALVTGPTVSLCMNFYEELLKTHGRDTHVPDR